MASLILYNFLKENYNIQNRILDTLDNMKRLTYFFISRKKTISRINKQRKYIIHILVN